MLISVIIPVYNTEEYLVECLDSLVNQNYKYFEALLINDGSVDSSGVICDEYAAKDIRFKVFHQENSGVSTARNLGVDNAQGDWITFVDSDDVIDEHLLSNLVKGTQGQSEFVLSGINRYKDNIIKPFFEFNNNETLFLKDFMLKYSLYQYYAGPWGKLFKNNIIKENNIYFNVDLSWGEDALFNLQYLKNCNIVHTVKYTGYNYRLLSSGLAKNYFPSSYYLHLINKLKREFSLIENRVGTIEKEKNFTVITGRLLSTIYTVSDDKQRMMQLNSVYKTNKDELISFFAQTKGLGRICFYLLKRGNLNYFDKFYRLLQ